MLRALPIPFCSSPTPFTLVSNSGSWGIQASVKSQGKITELEITLKSQKDGGNEKQFWSKIILEWGLDTEFLLLLPPFPLSMSVY